METTFKAFLVATLLLFSGGVKAQDNIGGYEFAIVQGLVGATIATTKVTIIKSNDVETVDVPKGKEVGTFLIQKIEELNKQGWVVYNVTPNTTQFGTIGFAYHIRRKLK